MTQVSTGPINPNVLGFPVNEEGEVVSHDQDLHTLIRELIEEVRDLKLVVQSQVQPPRSR